MKTMIKLIGVLTLTCLVAGLVLAWVHAVTLEPIARAEARQRRLAIEQVLPEGESPPVEVAWTDPEDSRTQTVHVRFDGQERWQALAFEVETAAGYGGDMRLMVGFAREPEREGVTLSGVYVLRHAETPGLGAKIQDTSFRTQLAGRVVQETRWAVRQAGGDIQAITAATVSSQAVLDAVRQAIARLARLENTLVAPSEVNP